MIKKLLMTSLIGLLLPMGVNAATFKDGDITYTLEKRKISCIEDKDFLGIDKNGNIIVIDYNSTDYSFEKIGSDNKCVTMTTQEILDFINEETYHYHIAPENNEQVVYKEYSGIYEPNFIPATSYDANKTYFEFDGSDYNMVTGTIDSTNITNYFELVFFVPPKNAIVDPTSDLKYYKLDSNNIEEVSNPKSDDILNYYIIDEDIEKYKSKKVKVLDTNKIIIPTDTYSSGVPTSYAGDKLYIDIEQNDKSIIYTLDGDKLFENVDSFYVFSNGLFSVIKDNTILEIYNNNKDLLYTETFADYENGYEEVYHKDNYSLLVKENEDEDKVYFYTLTETKPESAPGVQTPATGDNIVYTFIIGCLSLVGIVGIIIYSKKKKIFN